MWNVITDRLMPGSPRSKAMGSIHVRNTAGSIASRAHTATGMLAITPIAMDSTASNHPVAVRSLGLS
jgi:hypothetical protein